MTVNIHYHHHVFICSDSHILPSHLLSLYTGCIPPFYTLDATPSLPVHLTHIFSSGLLFILLLGIVGRRNDSFRDAFVVDMMRVVLFII